jgi:diguanylate cyclase (GGDEF)-like protein
MHITLRMMFQSTLFEGYAAEKHAWQALDELFEFWPHLLACITIVVCASFALSSGGGEYAAEAVFIAILHLVIRGIGGERFRRRAQGDSLHRWTTIFAISALFSGVGWGTSLALLLINAPLDSRYLLLTVACVIMQSANARAHMAPRPLIGQTSILVTLVSLASIGNGDWVVAPAALLFMAFQIIHMRNLIRLRLRQLIAEKEKDQALAQLETTNQELLAANETLRMHALTDGLTGLANRRAFDMHFSAQDAMRHRHPAPFSVILFDIDHFKHFNDTYGHQAGDTCLAAVGRALRELPLPKTHMIARYGGEEFVMVLPKTDEANAIKVAENLRQTIAAIRLDGARMSGITLSLGVVTLPAGDGASQKQMLEMADRALYRAKQNGRNRVEIERERVLHKKSRTTRS